MNQPVDQASGQKQADEIRQNVRDSYSQVAEASNEGTVVSVTDGIIRIHGLTNAMFGEMIAFSKKNKWPATPIMFMIY